MLAEGKKWKSKEFITWLFHFIKKHNKRTHSQMNILHFIAILSQIV